MQWGEERAAPRCAQLELDLWGDPLSRCMEWDWNLRRRKAEDRMALSPVCEEAARWGVTGTV